MAAGASNSMILAVSSLSTWRVISTQKLQKYAISELWTLQNARWFTVDSSQSPIFFGRSPLFSGYTADIQGGSNTTGKYKIMRFFKGVKSVNLSFQLMISKQTKPFILVSIHGFQLHSCCHRQILEGKTCFASPPTILIESKPRSTSRSNRWKFYWSNWRLKAT